EVYKRFTPMESRMMRHPMRMQGGPRMKGWERPLLEMENVGEENDIPGADALILVGLSMDRMESAQARLLRQAVGQGVVFFFLGCAGVISLMVFQAYRSTRARLAAMDDGGTLSVTVTDISPGEDLEIRVADDGCGMDEQVLSEIFDPYFTTRPDGTGLGLSIVHRLVETLGGDIRVESARDQGTTFYIRLSTQGKEEANDI
ncbi:MAG: ATP-binding protein, partial [Desulfotignum sp.]